MRYTKQMFEKNNGSVTYGRVLNFDHMRGYGFIRTEEGADIFLSSYNLSKKESQDIVIGTLISFVPELYNGGYSAAKIKILDYYPSGKELTLPTGETVRIKNLKKIGVANDDQKPYVYFTTKKGETYKVTAKDLAQKKQSNSKTVLDYWDSVKDLLLKV